MRMQQHFPMAALPRLAAHVPSKAQGVGTAFREVMDAMREEISCRQAPGHEFALPIGCDLAKSRESMRFSLFGL
jgi:hypothetical protein